MNDGVGSTKFEISALVIFVDIKYFVHDGVGSTKSKFLYIFQRKHDIIMCKGAKLLNPNLISRYI